MRARARPISAITLKMPAGPDAAAAMIVHRRSRRRRCARTFRRLPKHCAPASATRPARRASQQAAFISTRRNAALASAAVVQTPLRRCRRACRLPCRPQGRRPRQQPCHQQPRVQLRLPHWWKDAQKSAAPATLVKLRVRPISARTRRTAAEPDAAAATASPRRSRQRRCA